MDVQVADFVTIGLLVIIEGLLSADNALVLAILVLGLPKHEQRKALRYGILGAFFFRIIAIFLAVHLMQVNFVKLVGAAYLFWLTYSHFFGREEGEERSTIKPATAWMVKVELTDIVFAVDSILVAVAMSKKIWVIITGGILGIIAMRLVIGQLLRVVRRYPALVDGAFIIIGWVAIKLLVEYLGPHGLKVVDLEINKWFSMTLIVVIFSIAYFYARKKGAVVDDDEQEAAKLLEERGE
jgi:YkoY family integral membrane protein